MRIDHCGSDIFVAQELLHRSDVVAVLEQVSCKTVPQRMTRGPLCYTGSPNSFLDRSLNLAFIEMMTAELVRAWIAREFAGGENVLPTPLPIGRWKLAGQSIGHVNAANATL